MKTSAFRHILKSFLVLSFVCPFVITAFAQNYYPIEIGNKWVLENPDKKYTRTYTLEKPEDIADQNFLLLKIVTKKSRTVVYTDEYFVTTNDEGISLHKSVLQHPDYGNITADLPTPTIFFPNALNQGDKWKIVTDTKLFNGLLEVKSTTNLEIVGFEDVVTPTVTIKNCAKIALTTSISSDLITIHPTTSYQWLAPDLGPVKYQTSDDPPIVFNIISFRKAVPPIPDALRPPVWQLPALTFEVTGSRLGGVLTANILKNVEDYVSEVGNLGIENVTGNIALPGDGTGFATNSQGKQDLWIAGTFQNAPIDGTVTLFAENSKGKRTATLVVTINVR